MSAPALPDERYRLRVATERYVAALPPGHRQILAAAATRRRITPAQLVAGLIADAVEAHIAREAEALANGL